MPPSNEQRAELLEYLEETAGSSAEVELVGAYGAKVTEPFVSAEVLAVDDHGPNGARVIDVGHTYTGYGDPVAVVRVGWV